MPQRVCLEAQSLTSAAGSPASTLARSHRFVIDGARAKAESTVLYVEEAR